jgi:soluble lytic murein transglycosylase-like protein
MKYIIPFALSLTFACSSASAAMTSSNLIAASARKHGVPVQVALAVAKTESGFNCTARGSAGELGPLQIKPATARLIGYKGSAGALRSCGAGLEWGMRHLALAIRGGGVWKHNQGLWAKRKSAAARAYEARVFGQTITRASTRISTTRPVVRLAALRIGLRN